MNLKQTSLTALTALATCTLIACGGSNSGLFNDAEAPPAGKASPQPMGYPQQPGATPAPDAPTAQGMDSLDSVGDDEAGSYDAPSAPPSPAAQPLAGRSAPPPPPSHGAARRSESRPRDQRDPFALKNAPTKPGLATKWGEQRHSRVTSAPFVRADRSSPFATASLFYNDPSGIQAMANRMGGQRMHTQRFPVASGHLELSLRDGSGRFLSGFEANGNNYLSGLKNERYTIYIRNLSPGRIEAVVSVDGLDVIDGKSASFAKRGYLLDPFGDLEIEGFRTSTSQVAAFRFGAVSQSYAAKKHGQTRNVGVIGLAMFHERGDSPRFWGRPRHNDDSAQRHNADPFPNRFATP